MYGARDLLSALGGIAEGQWGMFTSAQATAVGASRMHLSRLVASGVLERIDQGLYSMPGIAHDGMTMLRAAWLSLDPKTPGEERLAHPERTAVVSHASAADIHRIGDLFSGDPEFTLSARKQTRRAIKLHRGTLLESDVVIVAGLPVTTVERTLTDLLTSGGEFEHVAGALVDAWDRGTIDLENLSQRLEPYARRYDAASGAELVDSLLQVGGRDAATVVGDVVKSLSQLPHLHSFANSIANTDGISAAMKSLRNAMPPITSTMGQPQFFSGVDLNRLMGIDRMIKPFAALPQLSTPRLPTGLLNEVGSGMKAAVRDSECSPPRASRGSSPAVSADEVNE